MPGKEMNNHRGDDERKPPAEADDEDDNWSRQVETDSTSHPEPAEAPFPTRNRSLREQLVLRERERRIETERARLKQQFALQNSINHSAAIDEEAAGDGSVAEESTRVHADEDTSEKQVLGFNMERFLRNSDNFDPPRPATADDANVDTTPVMERFLSEPVLVDPSVVVSAEPPVDRTVSFEDSPAPPAIRDPSFAEDLTSVDANTSVLVEADPDDIAQDALQNTSAMGEAMSDEMGSTWTARGGGDEPRLLRLTEADMQEMAAIEEASIGNAPPSEREEDLFSDDEVGELAGFTTGELPHDHVHLATLSQGTPTTAINSSVSNASARITSDIDAHLPESVPSRDEDDTPIAPAVSAAMGSESFGDTPLTVDENIVNRQIRPGMVPRRAMVAEAPGTGNRSAPVNAPVLVEGFDFDKESRSPLHPDSHNVYQGLPDDWPETPPRPDSTITPRLAENAGDGYGAILQPPDRLPMRRVEINRETAPLLGDVPPEIITHHVGDGDGAQRQSSSGRIMSAVESIFSQVHSMEEEEKEIINHECDIYNESSILARAFPERMFALFVTLLFELPVLLLISDGSEFLCQLIGRWRYQLLMGFIPLTSAISGNVGLQASTLTTRAISHNHVTAREYMPWFMKEVATAGCLGLAMGLLLGSVAFAASGFDVAFALTIFIAQVISIVTAGITGTFAPLLFSFFFKRDSGKWGGPLETAIQDIVGSFAMIVISYKILQMLGDGPRDENDICGPGSVG